MESMIPSLLDAAVSRLKATEPGWVPATTPPEKGDKPPARGKGLPSSTQRSSDGGSGFVESDAALRQYWPERVVATSSDGLFVVLAAPIKKVFGSPAPLEFQDPPT